MLNLIKIECNKARYSKTVFAALIICCIAIIAFGFFLKQDTSKYESDISTEEQQLKEKYENSENWKEKLEIKKELNTYLYSDEDTVRIENELLQYRIDNNLKPSTENTTWNFISYSYQIIGFLITVFAILFAIEIIVKEFSSKTTKLLFTTPFSRTPIILSKYITSVLFLFALCIIFYFITYITGGIYFTFKGAGNKNVFMFFEQIYTCSEFQYSFLCVLSTLINALQLMTFAFFLGIICRSQTVPLITNLGILFFGTAITDKLYSANFTVIRFSFLSQLSLQKYIDSPVGNGYSLALLVGVVVIHLGLFLFGSTLIIKKCDL